MEAEEVPRGNKPVSGRLLAAMVAIILLVSVVAVFVAWPRGGTAPGPSAPSPPTNVRASAGDGVLTVSWDAVEGAEAYHVYMASTPGVSKDGYAAMPDGARFADVLAPYTVNGVVNGRTYYARVTSANAAGESGVSAEVSVTPAAPSPPGTPLYVTGLVEADTGAPAVGAQVLARAEDDSASGATTTGGDGRFTVRLEPRFPTRVLVTATLTRPLAPSATGFRWSVPATDEGAVDVGRLVLPESANKRLAMVGNAAYAPDGSVYAEDLPPSVASVWAQPYEADVDPDAFPGDLAEGTSLPINNLVVLWISALDAAGQPVVDLGSPATVRVRVPATQWIDLEDLQPGNGMIDTPIYSLDYGTGYWVREADGLLTDAAGTAIPEGSEADLRAGTYAGNVYAEFQAGHFSWWNVDKPPTNCGTDFGDADDPPYPSLLASDGARHLNPCRAWLGPWVDAEDDADVPDADAYDDGLVARDPLTVRVTNWNWSGYLYLNALVDKDADGTWTGADEWVVQNLVVSVPTRKGKAVETDATWDGQTWLRLTVTGDPIPDYDGTGEFPIGETEDYPFLKYRLSVSVTGNGTVTSDPPGIDCRWYSGTCRADYRAGTTVNLTATPDSGESFLGWGGDCSGTNGTCTLVMDEDRQVSASFTSPYYRLSVYVYGNDPTQNRTGGGTVTSEPPGINCRGWNESGGTNGGENCTAVFPRGSNVTLTATPDPGWVFVQWGGDCTGTSPTCTITMDMDKWVVAYFERT